MHRKSILTIVAAATVLVLSCSDPGEKSASETSLATDWADLTLLTISTTPPNSPTFTSRNLGYIGLAMYECVVHGSPERRSLAGQLNGLSFLPLPEGGKEYNWSLALNAGQALLLKSFYGHGMPENIQKIEALEEKHRSRIIPSIPDETIIERSVAFGQSVASAIYEWSKTDGGHEGYLYHFDPTYVFPSGPGYWVPPVGGQSASVFPLHPYWGNNRTFLNENSAIEIPQILPYSTQPSSDYYGQFKQVYEKRNSLSWEEKNIAAWWADDPTQTASPPGHSYNLATIAIKTSRADLYTAAEAYAKTGIAVADSFINCWKCKYTYHAERPYFYILEFIDNDYTQFWPEPPFPAFSSGHATQSAAAAVALESVFGKKFPLTDNTYAKRQPDFAGILYFPRRFPSLWATAEECANSRFYGGIHTQQDNYEGQKQGIIIGENVSALKWKQ
jgi:hypothetical protein